MSSVPESKETIYSIRKYKNFETYSLLWLDASINSEENLTAQEKIRSSIHYLQAFDDLDECEKYIQSVSTDDRIVFIISGLYGQILVPRIYQLRQISSIYIYCGNREFHQQWSKDYRKVKGVHNQLDDLIRQIQFDYSGRRQNKSDEPLSILIFNSSTNAEQSTTELDGKFVQSQLLISCLLKMKTKLTDQTEFVSQCREIYKGNDIYLKYVQEFEEKYSDELAVWWYTQESFIYRLLNKALRSQNIDLLFLFRFFIRDIEQILSQQQYRQPVRVYRGQLMAKDELNQLKHCKNNLISTHSFLSTTLNRQLAYIYLDRSDNDDNFERVLFEIDADPSQIGVKPFADIAYMSHFPQEEEVLMMLGSVFRIKDIYLDEKQIWHIEMYLCSENDCDLHTVCDHMKKQYGSKHTRLLLFANVLIDRADFDDAEKYLCRLLKQLPSKHRDIPKCYHALGKVLCEKGNYQLSLYYFDKALQILEKFNINDCRIAYIHNNIGEVYQNQGNNNQALKSYQKALTIFQTTYGDNHEYTAWCYNNLGIIYEKEKNYSQAEYYLLKALNIKHNFLPREHPCLSNTYNNLGNVYYRLHKYKEALEIYEISYKIFKKSLTPRHPSIARILKNIGGIYEAQENFIEAKKNYQCALTIREHILSLTHPDLIEIKNDIARVALKNDKTS